VAQQAILDNKQVTLYYHTDTKIVHHVYHHGIGGAHLKEALNTGVDLLHKHKAIKWLSDNRAIEGHSEEESDWVNNVWLPNAINAGWKYWALVVPESVMGRMNAAEFVQSFHEQGIWVTVTTDPEAAMDWLLSRDA
jgi:hypothetical protein